jgi:hypothetical protein
MVEREDYQGQEAIGWKKECPLVFIDWSLKHS